MSRPWKSDLKFAGLLHDPIDKVIKIWGHASRAAEIAHKIGVEKDVEIAIKNHHNSSIKEQASPNAEKIHKILRNADTQASIANRIIILDYPRQKRQKGHLQENKLHLIHPFSGYAYYFPKNVLNFIETQQKLGLPNIVPHAKANARVLLDLLSDYYEVYGGLSKPIQKWLLHLPEDTRSPISSIFSHLEITGALAKLFDEGEFWLVYYDIGGVQEFISSARKTMDLWAASYIISLLSFCVLKKVANTVGYEHIILPWYPALPLGLLDLGFDVDPEDLVLPVTPNSALMLLPKSIPAENSIALSSIGDIYSFIFGEMERCWKIITEKAKQYLQSKLNDDNIKQNLDEIFEKELAFEKVFKNIRIVAIKVKFSNDQLKLEDATETVIEKIFDCTLGASSNDNSECEYKNLEELLNNYRDYLAYTPKGLKQDFFFPAIIKLVQLIMRIGSTRKVRGNYEYSMNEGLRQKISKGKCTMCGFRDAIFDYSILKELDFNERLCAVDTIKRVFREEKVFVEVLAEIFSDKKDKSIKDKFNIAREKVLRQVPSTEDIAQSWYRFVLSQVIILDKNLKMQFNKIKGVIKNIGELLSEEIIESLDYELWDWENRKDYLTREELQIRYTAQRIVERLRQIHIKLKNIKNEVSFEDIPAVFLNNSLLDELLALYNESHLKRIYGSETIKHLAQIKEQLVELSKLLNDLNKELERFLENPDNQKAIIDDILKRIVSEIVGTSVDSINDDPYYLFLKNYKNLLPLPYKPQDTFAILAMDGDNMGKWISGELNIPLILTLGRRDYLEELSKIFSGDAKLNSFLTSTKALMTPSLLTTLSMIISLNSREVLRIIRAFRGFLIYTGGDDVLALLPPEVAHIVALILRVIFSRELIETEYLGKRLRVYGLGWRATASIAIFYADTKYDFRDAIMRAHSLLDDLAKKYNPLREGLHTSDHDKDGLVMALASRSSIITKTEYPLPQFLIVSKKQNKLSIQPIKEYYNELIKELKTMGTKGALENIVRSYESSILQDGLLSDRGISGDTIFVGIEPSFLGRNPIDMLNNIVKEEPKVYSSILALHTIEALIKSGLLSKRFIHDSREHFKSFIKDSEKKYETLLDLDEFFWRLLQRLIKRRLSDQGKKFNLHVSIQKLLKFYGSHIEPVSFLNALKIIDRVLTYSFLLVFERERGDNNDAE